MNGGRSSGPGAAERNDLIEGSLTYHGWWLVLACIVILALTAGVATYSFSLFAIEFEREFGASRATVMWAASGHALVSALIAPQLGVLLDRFPARNVVVASALCLGCGLILASHASSIWPLIMAWVLLVPIGTTTLTALLAPVLLTRWFTEKRGLALGIASMGTKFGGLLVPPIVAFALVQWHWRVTLRGLAIILMIVVVTIAWLLIVDRPQQKCADDAGVAARGTAAHAPAGWKSLTGTPGFWLLSYYMSVILATFAVLLSNFAMLVAGVGASKTEAALLLSTFSFVGLFASPLVGRFCDRIEVQRVAVALALLNASSLALYAVSRSMAGLALASVLAALGGGGISTFLGVLASRLFDPRIYGRAIGAVLLCAGFAAALAPVAAGWLYDRTSSYRAALSALIVLLLVAALLSPSIRVRSAGT